MLIFIPNNINTLTNIINRADSVYNDKRLWNY